MQIAPDPNALFIEAIADGLTIDHLEDPADQTRSVERYARVKRLETLVQAHRRVLEQSPSSIDLDLDSIVVEPGGPADPARPADHPSRWGHLEILESVGGGGFGQVFRARDPMLDREVALKLIFPRSAPPEEVRRRFLAEARRLARVRHDHVVVVHGAGIHDGRMGIWTDFLEGFTLEHLIKQNGPMSPREAALIGVDLCRALAAVHRAGLIHRDVKTGNVMRETGGRIVLLDFGLVAADPAVDAEGALESTGGTPLYMAPEVLRREPATVTSDVYSLGVLLYRLVSGRYPIEATRLSEIVSAMDEGRRTPLRTAVPEAPTAFVRVVEKAIALDPAERYPSTGAMELALIDFVNPAAPALPWWRRGTTWVGGTIAAAIVATLLWVGPRLVPPPFDVEASMFRTRDGRPEQILTGSAVLPGDQLHLRVKSSREARAVVLNREPDGRIQQVFPPESAETASTLSAGTDVRLPVDAQGEEIAWTISSPTGTESFILIVVRGESPRLQDALAAVPKAVFQEEGALGDLAVSLEQGPGGDGKAILTRRKTSPLGEDGAFDALLRIANEERSRGADIRVEQFAFPIQGSKE